MDDSGANINPEGTPEVAPTPTEESAAEPMTEPVVEPTAAPTPEASPESISETPSSAPVATTAPEHPKASKPRIIVFAVASSIIVVAVVVALVFQLLHIFGPFGGKESLYEHDAYFLPESTKTNTKYALVGKDGKELTEYNIEKFDQFVDGYTIVKTTDGWGIMDDTGRMTVKPNEYDALSRVGGLYTALKPGSSERKLLHGSGREVTSYSSSLNSDLGSDNHYGSQNAFAVVINRGDNQYDIYNARGKKITSVESERAPIVSSVTPSSYDYQGTVTAISYSGGITVLRNSDLEELIHTEDSHNIYELLDVSLDATQMVFSEIKDKEDDKKTDGLSYISGYSHYADGLKRAIYTGGKFKEIGDDCRSINIIDSEDAPTGYISCISTDNGSGFYSSDGTFHNTYSSKTRQEYIVMDADHYATRNYGSSGGATIYINGQSVGQGLSIAKAKNNFIVRQSGGGMQVYDKNGKKVCSASSLANFGGFDKNGVAIVYSRNISTYSSSYSSYISYDYRLMNQSCSTISDSYYSIAEVGNYYVATSRTQSTSSLLASAEIKLLDANGKSQLSDSNISSISSAGYRGKAKKMIVVKKSDGKSTLYNEKLEKIVDFEGSILYDTTQDMVKVYGEKFINFYTPEGTELSSVPIGDGARART